MKKSLVVVVAIVLIATMMTTCKKDETVVPFDGRRPAPPSGMASVQINVIADGFDSSARDTGRIESFRINTLNNVKNSEPFVAMPDTVLNFATPKRLNAASSLQSVLGITPKQTGCYFTFAADFQNRLDEVKKDLPAGRITLVIVNVRENMTVGACAVNPDLIVTSTQVDRDAIAHELGHSLGGLKDETVSGRGVYQPVASDPYRAPNCADNDRSPGWTIVNTSTAEVYQPTPGCEGYSSGLFRPTDSCGMQSPGAKFCCVCTEHMFRQISDLVRTPLSPPSAVEICDVDIEAPEIAPTKPTNGTVVTVDYYSLTNAKIVKRVRVLNYDARSPLIVGDTFGGLTVDKRVVAATSLRSDPTFARAYAPGKATVDVPVLAPIPARVVMFIPDGGPGQITPAAIPLSGFSGVSRLDDRMRQKLSQALQ